MPDDYGVYLHVPWCRVRCPYCAFYVEPDRDARWAPFADAVLREYAVRAPIFPGPARSVFLGGGTPSRLPAALLAHVLAPIARVDEAEISAEANPEDLHGDWLDAAVEAGINRLSIGVQTFNPDFARLLNRANKVAAIPAILERVRTAGLRSWSVDVIFALPGQSLHDLAVDIDAILAEDPPHVSLYGLTFEPGTPFARARDRGTLKPPPDGLWREMYDLLVARLESAGLFRYEVSNFARPGHESDHNRGYWAGRPYLGLGPSAHGLEPGGARWVNVADIDRYLQDADPTAEREVPDPLSSATDRLISGMRGIEGVDLDDLRVRTGCGVDGPTLSLLATGGLIRWKGRRIALTEAGFPISDAVVRKLVDGLHPAGVS